MIPLAQGVKEECPSFPAKNPRAYMVWIATTRWKPTKSGESVPDALALENDEGEIGYGKPAPHLASEKIASDFGRLIGAPVPEVRLEYSEPHRAVVAVSIVSSESDIDLHSWLGQSGSRLECIAAALRAASGLLPYYAWFFMADRSPWNLVVADSKSSGPSIVDVDHDYVAVGLMGSENLWLPPGDGFLDALTNNVDRRVVMATVKRIERLRLKDLKRLVASISARVVGEDLLLERIDDPAEELFRRSKLVRRNMYHEGWLP